MLLLPGLKTSIRRILQFAQCNLGERPNNFNPFATVDWMAYQGAPPEGMTGEIKMQKWWSGTKCADVTFPKVAVTTFFLSFSRKIFMIDDW